MSTKEILLIEIEAFLSKTGMRETTFGRHIYNDTAFVSRLRKPPSDVTTRTLDRVRDFMRDHPRPTE